MKIIVSMTAEGRIVAKTLQGQILAECFFKTEDETVEELWQMGYARLRHTYDDATLEAGTGIEPADLEDIFIESAPPMAQ